MSSVLQHQRSVLLSEVIDFIVLHFESKLHPEYTAGDSHSNSTTPTNVVQTCSTTIPLCKHLY